MPPFLLAVVCVVGLAAGQLMFKAGANQLSLGSSLFSVRVLTWLAPALVLYATTTLAWIWLLKSAELGKIYPVMALAFVLVPLGSYLIFGESFSLRYLVGVILIIAGLLLTTTPG